MKKMLKLSAALCLSAVLCLSFSACAREEGQGGNPGNGGGPGGSSGVRTTVTEEEWNKAMYESLHNFFVSPDINVTVVGSALQNDDGEYIKEDIEYQVDGNKVHLKYYAGVLPTVGAEALMDVELYAEILSCSVRADGEEIMTANVYGKDESGQWAVAQVDGVQATIAGLLGFAGANLDLEEVFCDYEHYTYNESLQLYEAKDIVFDVREEYGVKYSFEFALYQFEDGKLIGEEKQGEWEQNGSFTESTTYSYGTASVTLPQVSLPQAEE